MRDTSLKQTELLFRRLLIRALRFISSRNRQPDKAIDYNKCKFLFIRQDRIGDVLISTPLFHILKNHYPGSTIDALLSDNNHFVLANDPNINKRWIYKKNIINIIHLIRALRKEKYDFAVDLIDNPSATSTLLCLMTGAQWNIGLQKQNSYIYDIAVPLLSRRDTHIVDRIAQLLIPFRINPAEEVLKIRYYVSKESEIFANKFITENKLQNDLLIGINISAGGNSRFWGVDNFKAFISHIKKTHPDMPVIVLFKPSDIIKAKDIAGSFIGVFLSPVTEMYDQFAAIIKRLKLFVSPDTSAVHLASAFNIPSIIMYVQSDNTLRIWEPYDSECETLVTNIDDISTIPKEKVISAFDRIIKLVISKRNNVNSNVG